MKIMRHPFHNEITLITTLNTVTVAWSPGHSGIPGNKLADETAKEGAAMITMTPQPIIPVSYRRCRTEQWSSGF
uniref:RNase H domain-containing protein n=1 Tax=Rhodnius prolixus TaxID=13249 RepID=T1I6F0_RHOPR